MHIILCGSMTAMVEMVDIEDQLIQRGYTVSMPQFMEGESPANHAESSNHKIKHNLIRGYFEKISKGDAILVVNVERKGIPGYIGGNSFLEMGFAYVLQKPIYLWSALPEMGYTDEIVAMEPVVINQDVTKIQP